jgi:hypothetical protein
MINIFDGCFIIENVWAHIKDQVEKKKNIIKNQDDLWNETCKAFLGKSYDLLIKKLYESLTERVEELIKQKGGYID